MMLQTGLAYHIVDIKDCITYNLVVYFVKIRL